MPIMPWKLSFLLSAPEESTLNCSDLNYSSLYAFVKFHSARAAKKAKKRISGKRLLGGQFLKVSFSFSPCGNNFLPQLLHNFQADNVLDFRSRGLGLSPSQDYCIV